MPRVPMANGQSSSKCVLTPQSGQELDIKFRLKENSDAILACSPHSFGNNLSEI